MYRLNWLVTIFVLVALLLSACQPVMPAATTAAPAGPVPVPHTAREDAPPYGLRGPYAVGVRDFVIEGKDGERSIPVSVWYPALNPDGRPDAITYMLAFNNPDYPDFAIAGRALRDADPDPTGSPYPLVVHSHGLWLFRQASIYLTEQLASWGFVVIAGDHEDNWSNVFGESQVDNYVNRPQDIRREIDFTVTLNEGTDPLAGLIDTERVGVTGHSYGAETALLAGGARLNTNHFITEWCAMNPGDLDDPLNDCAAMPDLLDKMAEMAGLETVPTDLWPDWSDPRVDAVASLLPGAAYFGPEGLAALHVPVLLMEVEFDFYYRAANTYYHPYTLLPDERKTHVYFEAADHFMFNNDCAAMPGVVAEGFGIVCMDPVWDTNRVHDLVNHFVTAFLLAELKGDTDAAAALAPENVTFPGIQYETTTFATPPTLETVAPLPNVAEIEALIQKAMAENEIPGMALGIVNGGEIAYTNAFGVERVGTATPVTLHSIFGTGSIGKTATATAIMQLVEQGKIDLDASVTDYLPYFKLADERYKAITIRHLITHRSGLPEVEEWFPEPVEYDDGALERYVQSLSTVELLFAPGEQWSYSGNGFIVLADVVAKTSGQTFEEYLRDQIVDPLGMSDTLLIVQEADQPLMVGNHVRDEQGEVVVSEFFPYRRQFAPTGPLNSSITDMTRYAAAQLGRGELDGTRILAAETYDRMWEKISDLDLDFGEVITPLFTNYGMGWTLGEIDGHRIAAHFGLDEGFSAAMLLAPDDEVAVVLISNYFDQEEFNLAVWETAIQTMRMMLEPGE